jgi:hypothetical protein
MDGFDAGVADEILLIEGENPAYGVHSHRRDQSRVVDLDTRDVVRDQELAPFLMHSQSVGQEA